MSPSGSPTVRRRRLAAELRRLRGRRTGTQVARGVGWSPTKISRAESGRDSIPPEEVEKLLDFYGVADPLRRQLLSLAEDAAQRGWWEDYADSLTPEYIEYIGLEAEATSIAYWDSDVVPGLLQTEDYARQLIVAFQHIMPTLPRIMEERLRVRMIRQQRLAEQPPLQVSVILDEAVLLRRVGDAQVMRAQLGRLEEMATMPHVKLRVLPLNNQIPLVATSFAILSFGTHIPGGTGSLGDVVSVESIRTELQIEGETELLEYRLFYEALSKTALSPEASRDMIHRTLEGTWA